MPDTKISELDSYSASDMQGRLDYVSFPLIVQDGSSISNGKTTARALAELFEPPPPSFLLVNVEQGTAPVWEDELYNGWSGGSSPILYSGQASWVAEIPDEIGPHVRLEVVGTWRIELKCRLSFRNSEGGSDQAFPDGGFAYGTMIDNSGEPGLVVHPQDSNSTRHFYTPVDPESAGERGRRLTWTDTYFVTHDGGSIAGRVAPYFYIAMGSTEPVPNANPRISIAMSAVLLETDQVPN